MSKGNDIQMTQKKHYQENWFQFFDRFYVHKLSFRTTNLSFLVIPVF